MIKLKDLLSETSISMGQVHSNPYATCFKSPKELESVNESMDDLVIKRGLELSLKDAGFKVKKFKKAKPGYNEIWAGVFHTKNAVMAFSYSKYGDVFYSGKNIGKLNSKGLLNWLKDIKSNNKWMESVNEKFVKYAPGQWVVFYEKGLKDIPIQVVGNAAAAKKLMNKLKGKYKNIGRSERKDFEKDNGKIKESVNEKVARPMSYRLRKAQDEIEYMITQGPLDDEDVYSNPGQAMKLLQTAQRALGKIK